MRSPAGALCEIQKRHREHHRTRSSQALTIGFRRCSIAVERPGQTFHMARQLERSCHMRDGEKIEDLLKISSSGATRFAQENRRRRVASWSLRLESQDLNRVRRGLRCQMDGTLARSALLAKVGPS